MVIDTIEKSGMHMRYIGMGRGYPSSLSEIHLLSFFCWCLFLCLSAFFHDGGDGKSKFIMDSLVTVALITESKDFLLIFYC